MSKESIQLEIALELLGLNDQIVSKGSTITGAPEMFSHLDADGAHCEINVVQEGPNVRNGENPVFHFIPAVLEKRGLNPAKAKEILYLMRGAFSPADYVRLIEPACQVLDHLLINPKPLRLKWLAGPSVLGYLIGQLVENGYIEAPLKRDGEINDINTLRKSVNPANSDGLKYKNQQKFRIPHTKELD
jgi:hypothetical protein